MPWRSKILKTPTCAMPRAKPPPRASPTRGRGPLAVSARPKPREVIAPNERAIDRPERSALSARRTVNELPNCRPKECVRHMLCPKTVDLRRRKRAVGPLAVVESTCDGCHRCGGCDHMLRHEYVRGGYDSSR